MPLAAQIAAKQVVVLYIDECHLSAGDACGYAWGPSKERISVPILNQRDRQTYYGAIDAYTGELIVVPLQAGNTEWTLIFVEYLREQFTGKRLILCWDGASYHRSTEMREYLEGVNLGHSREQWPITCIQFAPYAPEQNPIEDVWLQAKDYVRKRWYRCKEHFQSITDLFEEALNTIVFDFEKLRMYLPNL
jgi:transposase